MAIYILLYSQLSSVLAGLANGPWMMGGVVKQPLKDHIFCTLALLGLIAIWLEAVFYLGLNNDSVYPLACPIKAV